MNTAFKFRAGAFAGLVCAVLLTACGGGGYGGSGTPSGTPPPPVVAPGGLTYSSPVTVTLGVAMSALTPSIASSSPYSSTVFSVSPALPAGLSLDPAAGTISGTPTSLTASATYTVTASNSAGNTSFALSLQVAAPVASTYSQSNLVSDGSVAALHTDVNLKNPWGLVFATGAPVWLTNNVTNTSTLYDGSGTPVPLVVAIAPGLAGAAAPTGIVANTTTDFTVTKNAVTAAARFIFAGEGGTISAWAPTVDPANAVIAYDGTATGTSYKGLAIASSGTTTLLYATDFKNKKVDVFDKTFAKVAVTGGFTDSTLPAGYAPFGIQAVTIGGTPVIVVTYASQNVGGTDPAPGVGLGVVNVFDVNGTLLRHLVAAGGQLNAPWGVALAPPTFGSLSNMLLIGNFGDGQINGYDPVTGIFAGTISASGGAAIANNGLWGIAFGNGARNQFTKTLFFAAGVGGETGGLYGRIDLGATAPDVVAPSGVAITAPAAGTVAGSVVLTAAASDNVGVSHVDFQVKIGTTTTTIGSATTAPFSVTWNSTTAANGPATLTAVALDAAGNSTTSAAVAVTVNNVAAVTLQQLQDTIFTPICSGCHTGVGAVLPGVMNLASASASLASLVNVTSLEVGTLKRVTPGDPNNSYIVQKLEGTQTVGVRMPATGLYLDQPTIDKVRAWIQAGATP
jgi:uncharacterized protein (TIGR03118 family)